MKARVTFFFVVLAAAAALVGAWLGGWFVKVPGSTSVDAPPAVAVPRPVPPPQPPTAVPQAPAAASSPPAAPSAPAATPMAGRPAGGATPAPPAPAVPALAPDVRDQARAAIDTASLMFRDYRTIMSENPVGSNAEIMKAINGGNPKGARLMHEGQQLNGNGELVDQWGTPYFFHQMSATSMEITSAGPDKKFGTPDDITGR